MDIEQVSYTKFRMNLASFIGQVSKSNLPIRIVRRDNMPVYLISKEMYENLIEHISNQSKKDKSKKTDSIPQEHVQVRATVQQDLFN